MPLMLIFLFYILHTLSSSRLSLVTLSTVSSLPTSGVTVLKLEIARNLMLSMLSNIFRNSELEYSFGCLNSIPCGSPATTHPKLVRSPYGIRPFPVTLPINRKMVKSWGLGVVWGGGGVVSQVGPSLFPALNLVFQYKCMEGGSGPLPMPIWIHDCIIFWHVTLRLMTWCNSKSCYAGHGGTNELARLIYIPMVENVKIVSHIHRAKDFIWRNQQIWLASQHLVSLNPKG